MYTMVLMAALTTGADMPDFGRRGCHGCWGGCWGGCYGCWGGCYGGWGGCWGGCYGGWGGGCWGGCYGGWAGGWGGWGGWGYAYAPVATTYAAPLALAYNPIPAASPVVTTRSMYPNSSADNRATIIVHVPENAQLIVDGKPTSSTSATRRFYSPPLEPGKSYHYTFEARMERDGKTVKAQRTVDVTANDRREITITMPDLNSPPDTPRTGKSEEKTGIRDRQRAGG